MSKIKRMLIFIVFLLALMTLPDLYAAVDDLPSPEKLKFERFGIRQGFHQGIVTCIFRDNKGFIWFGTNDGLNKYDGYNFTVYKHRYNDANTPGHKHIRCIRQDREGLLWLGTDDSLDRFDPAIETFTHYRTPLLETSPQTSTPVYAIIESLMMPGFLWVGTENGLEKFDKEKGTFTLDPYYVNVSKNFNNPAVGPMCESPPGILWFSTANNGLFKYDFRKKELTRFINEPDNPNTIINNYVNFIHPSRLEPGILWLATRSGLDKFDPVKETFVHYRHDPAGPYSLSHYFPWTIFESLMEEEKGVLWIGMMGGGLNKFNPLTGKAVHYKNDPNDFYSLSNNFIFSVHQTPSGALWIGTNGGGLCKVEGRNKKFILYQAGSGSASLSNNVVLSMVESRLQPGILWIGTYDGLNKFNRKTGQFTIYREDPHKPDGLRGKTIDVIYECPREPEILWLGTRNHGINQFNPEENTFVHYKDIPKNPATVDNIVVMALHKSALQPGTLWVGTYSGDLDQLIIKTKTFIRCPLNPDTSKEIFPVTDIYESPSYPGILWVGTYGRGLIKFDIKSKKFLRFLETPGKNGSPGSNIIYSIYESPRQPGIFWLPTTKGLIKFNPKTGTGMTYKGTESLADYITIRILEDENGEFWISTAARGMLKFNPKTGFTKTYDIRDGLQGNEFEDAACKSQSGEMFFGGLNGFNAFYPHQVKDNPFVPPVVLTDFQIFNRSIKPGDPGRDGRPILVKSIWDTQTLQLSHKDKMFSFEFAALNYTQSENNQYAYKMEGFDSQWQYIGKRRLVTFTGLSPGDYTFRVKGSNNDAVWNEVGTSIRVSISPPWWRTPWAYSLYVILLGLILVGLYRQQRARLIKQEQEKTKIREAQLQAQAAEAQARAIEAENRRKTNELEEARKLQLSMLPEKLPESLSFDISVYMKTAYEVGGDYYDFYLANDGTLTAAIGDATGHGLKAGTMVSIIKAIFLTETRGPLFELDGFFSKSTGIIKQMNLGNLFMALTLVRIKDNKGIIASAGMPPAYLYRENPPAVEEIVLKAPPIGAFHHFSYPHKEIEFKEGDTLLLLSDGLPELFNRDGEMFGYSRLKQLFADVGKKTPGQIIAALVAAGESWLKGKPQDDDMTFVVLKVK